MGREYDGGALPEIVRAYEKFKKNPSPDRGPVPNVPFQMLTSLQLGQKEWTEIARNAPWQMTRMNLNTFARHGVFESWEMANIIAQRLRNPELVERARAFPYQLMVAYTTAADVPLMIRESLQDAMEIAIQNVPRIEGKVYVCPDISGSMHSPATGIRKGSTTAVRCIDIAALVAAAVLRKNPQAEVIPFESDVVRRGPESARFGDDQRPATGLAALRRNELQRSVATPEPPQGTRRRGDLRLRQRVVDRFAALRPMGRRRDGDHATVGRVQAAQPGGKDDLHRHPALRAHPGAEREDIINIGGFSDQVFNLIAEVAAGGAGKDHWVRAIAATRL